MRLWKKVLAATTAGVLCLGSVSVPSLQNVLEPVGTMLSASATVPYYYDGTYEDLYYDITDAGEITITGCNKNAVSVEIPREINGKSVTKIGGYAFGDCTSLTAVTIPDSVTSIGGGAFSETLWLTKKQEENPLVIVNGILIDGTTCTDNVVIPDGVTSIGDNAFSGCTSLTEITIPDSVTEIELTPKS